MKYDHRLFPHSLRAVAVNRDRIASETHVIVGDHQPERRVNHEPDPVRLAVNAYMRQVNDVLRSAIYNAALHAHSLDPFADDGPGEKR